MYCQAQEGPGCLGEQMAAGLGQTGEKRRCGHPGSAGELWSLLFSPLDKKKILRKVHANGQHFRQFPPWYMMQNTESQEHSQGISQGTRGGGHAAVQQPHWDKQCPWNQNKTQLSLQMQCFLQEPSAIWRIGEIKDSSMVWTDIAMDSSCSCFSLWSDQEKINRLPGNRAETHESKTCETLGNDYKGDYGINYRTIFESIHLLY